MVGLAFVLDSDVIECAAVPSGDRTAPVYIHLVVHHSLEVDAVVGTVAVGYRLTSSVHQQETPAHHSDPVVVVRLPLAVGVAFQPEPVPVTDPEPYPL